MTQKNAQQIITYPVEYVVKLVKDNKLVVPEFQRRYWWPMKLQVALINTILGDRVVMPLFLLRYVKIGVDEIGDGQQRVTTLRRFIDNEFTLDKTWCESPDLSGLSFKHLSKEDQNKILTYCLYFVTVIADDMTEEEKVQIFVDQNPERAGIKHQEVRNARYFGHYNNFLKKMAGETKFMIMFNSRDEHPRMNDIEAVLAFFTDLEGKLSWGGRGFQDAMSKFMSKERISVQKMEDKDRLDYLASLRDKFRHGIDACYAVFGKEAFKARKIRSNMPALFNVKYFVTFMTGFQKYSLADVTFHKDEIKRKINEWISKEPESWHGHEAATISASANRRVKFEEIMDGIIGTKDAKPAKATA